MFADDPHAREYIRRQEQVITTGRAGRYIDGREDTLVTEFTVKLQFLVTGAFELLEDEVVHLTAGLCEGCSDDSQTTAVLNITGSTEEAFGLMQGLCLYTTAEHFSARRCNGIIGSRKACDGVEQDDYVMSALDEAFGFLVHDISHLNVVLSRFVKGRSDNLCFNGTRHVGHFFRTLVYEQYDHINLRMIGGNGIGYLLE